MRKKIKVVHIANFDLGLKVHLGNYMRYLCDQGYSISAITHPGSWLTRDTTILDGIFVKIMTFDPRISPLVDFKTLLHLICYLRKEKFDIVHTHTIKPGFLGRIAAKIVGVPVIVHTVHGFYSFEGMSQIQNGFYALFEKIGSACSDLILSQNKQDIACAVDSNICSSDKIHYLGNGIDLNRFDPSRVSQSKVMALRNEFGILPHEKIIGFASRWAKEKGLIEFLEAANYLKLNGYKAKYLIVGNSQPRKNSALSAQKLMNQYAIRNNTILAGYREDIPELLSLMDIVVYPSHGREGIPRILMESSALGRPIVATRVRGILEAVENGVTGVLVPKADGRSLAKAIIKLIEDQDYATELGQRARQRATLNFDERFFFHKTDIEYRRLLKKKIGLGNRSTLRPVHRNLSSQLEPN